MKLLVPSLLAVFLFAAGRHYSGVPAGIFLGALGAVVGWNVGRLVRGRSMRNAPPAPDLRAGEAPLLHGPLELLQSQGPARPIWAYLSTQRLSLCPLDLGDAVHLELTELDEIRPIERSWRGGRLSLVFKGQVWKLRVPDARRWETALRSAGPR